MNGTQNISSTFEEVRPRAAFMPYTTIGFPSFSTSLDIVEAIASAGADLIELGIPFSDPLADGPTIQRSTQIALERGIDVPRCLEFTARLRERGIKQPLLLMGYFNPILAFGLEKFVLEAIDAGADGLIIPDLPFEEAGQMEEECRAHGCTLIYMLAPTSTQKRIALITARAQGFLYLVSLRGTTGARTSLPATLKAFVDQVRGHTDLPLAVGFGISTPEQARAVAYIADGVIVGSAIIDAVNHAVDGRAPEAAAQTVWNLRKALEPVMEEEGREN